MIPVVLAFTPNYFIPASVCIKSIIDSSYDKDKFEFICLLSESLTEEQNSLLETFTNSEKASFRYIELDGRLNHIKVSERFSTASLYRMILPDLLPNYDKVIYHDCDIIIRQNIAELYRNIELGENYLGVVYEATLPNQYRMLKDIGCAPGKYFNSGFLVMNLNLMRKDRVSDKLIFESTKTYSEFLDQDVLNKVCRDKVLPIAPKYNFNRTMILPKYKDIFLKYYTNQDWIDGVKNGNIHYTGGKPWSQYTVMYSLWWDVYFRLPKVFRVYLKPNFKQKIIYCLEKNYISNIVIRLLKRVKHIL